MPRSEQAADWARKALDEKWGPLVDRAWTGRETADSQATVEDIGATLDLMRYAVGRVKLP